MLIATIKLIDGNTGRIYILGDTDIEIFGVCREENKTLSEGHKTIASCIDFIKIKYRDPKWNLKLI